MTHGSHERPGRWHAWRVATPVAVLVSGVLLGVSAGQSDGHDLRGGRATDLASIVKAESRRTSALTDEAAALTSDVEKLSAGLGDRSVGRVQREIRTITDSAGLEPNAGAAVRVTLDDATLEAREAYTGNPNDLIVHQQDLQAVANAMWRAGATAVTIQGQRLVSTTGIKCDGNNVTLHGIPYAPPYVLVGIGDPSAMYAELTVDPTLTTFRAVATVPTGGVTWQVEFLDHAIAPAYEGLLDVRWAEPLDV